MLCLNIRLKGLRVKPFLTARPSPLRKSPAALMLEHNYAAHKRIKVRLRRGNPSDAKASNLGVLLA